MFLLQVSKLQASKPAPSTDGDFIGILGGRENKDYRDFQLRAGCTEAEDLVKAE